MLAAFNIKTGRVFGRVVPHRDADTLVTFMNALARRYPNKKVYIVWDNLSIHHEGKANRWTSFNRRHGKRFRFVYTPIHASWLNQVEIWFSILHRRVLKFGGFDRREVQQEPVEGFIRQWNRWERHPFRWTWRSDKRKVRAAKAA